MLLDVIFLKSGGSPRVWALQILMAVEKDNAYANLALSNLLDQVRPNKLDRAFTTELVYGTLRTLNTLDWALGQYTSRPLAKLTLAIRNILRLGCYQIMFLDRVPDAAAVNESASLARRFGHAGVVKFVNGVLRNLARGKDKLPYPDARENPVAHIALKYSHPDWLVRRWLSMFGFEDTVALCQANNLPAPNVVRVNTLKTNLDDLVKELKEAGVKVQTARYAHDCLYLAGFVSMTALAPWQQGLLQIQDESSILVGQALQPQPGTRVLDVASAPGGKATHLAQLMQNQGEITALDVHEHKIKLINDNCRRLGVTIVRAQLLDAREIKPDTMGLFDYVLVDAPCSGLGVLRRRPDARWRKDEQQIKTLANLQQQILNAAAQVVKPGGVLVYSTCTITREENLGQVENFLCHHPTFKLDSLQGFLPASLDQAATMGQGYLQIMPYLHGLDGFFMARLIRAQ